MKRYLHIGGVVAVGFDPSGEYLLVITHSGRGVFSTRTWERVARSTELAYPQNGIGFGIGPIDGQAIAVTEMNYATGEMRVVSPHGRVSLECESSGISVTTPDALSCDEILRIAHLDAQQAYGDLSAFRITIQLEPDGWHVDYEIARPMIAGGGPHYVIDSLTGCIIAKRYEQ